MGKEKAGVERDGDVLCTSRTEEGGGGRKNGTDGREEMNQEE